MATDGTAIFLSSATGSITRYTPGADVDAPWTERDDGAISGLTGTVVGMAYLNGKLHIMTSVTGVVNRHLYEVNGTTATRITRGMLGQNMFGLSGAYGSPFGLTTTNTCLLYTSPSPRD